MHELTMEDRRTDSPIWSAHTRRPCCNADSKESASTLALLTTSTVIGMILRAAFHLLAVIEKTRNRERARCHLRPSRDYRRSSSGQSEQCSLFDTPLSVVYVHSTTCLHLPPPWTALGIAQSAGLGSEEESRHPFPQLTDLIVAPA
jgi:hypothetical protein